MNLSEVTAVIRPRNAWEAMDLGFRLVQRDFLPLALRWVIATLPWALVALAIGIWTENMAWSYLLFWWMKPAFDRVPLQFLSRRLFGSNNAQTSFVRVCVTLPLSYSAWKHLSYLRFAVTRSFTLPIYQLEGQSSKNQTARIQTILARDYGAAAWLTMTLFFIALFSQLIITSFISGFWQPDNPGNTPLNFFDQYIYFWDNYPGIFVYLDFLAFYCVQGIIELFYVGAGFALYLNRRTHLEAWDIELAFRRMTARLSKTGASLIVVLALGGVLFSPHGAQAQALPADTPSAEYENFKQLSLDKQRSASREAVAKIYQAEEFGKVEINQQWRPIADLNDEEIADLNLNLDVSTFLKLVTTVLKYLIIGSLLAILITWIVKNKHLFIGAGTQKTEATTAPRENSQDFIKPVFQPDPNVPDKVIELWGEDNKREALSYLYRSALAYLTDKHQLSIDDSDTEGDCLRLVKSHANREVYDYFQQLTRVWRSLAYGEIAPENRDVEELCSRWPVLVRVNP